MASSRQRPPRPARVLVIDDSVEQSIRLKEIFAAARIPVDIEAITNGVDAVNRIQGWGAHAALPDPDIALIDLDLPRLDGAAVLSVIKASRHRAMITLVYATRLRPEQREACEALGADACLAKPDDFDSYVTMLAEILFFLSMRDDAALAWWAGAQAASRRRPAASGEGRGDPR